MAEDSGGFFSGFSIGDVFGGYVELEKAKYNQRLAGIGAEQNVSAAPLPSNTNATQNPQAYAGVSGFSKMQVIGGAVAVAVIGLIIMKVKK